MHGGKLLALVNIKPIFLGDMRSSDEGHPYSHGGGEVPTPLSSTEYSGLSVVIVLGATIPFTFISFVGKRRTGAQYLVSHLVRTIIECYHTLVRVNAE
jgi:hypothetical protein